VSSTIAAAGAVQERAAVAACVAVAAVGVAVAVVVGDVVARGDEVGAVAVGPAHEATKHNANTRRAKRMCDIMPCPVVRAL
jgi:hypothetical protein